jgi:hypothetical protein
MTMASSLRIPSAVRRRLVVLLTTVSASFVCGSAWGHVAFEAPSPDAVLVGGSILELRWVDVISHQTTAYHLELRTNPDATGVSIAMDLPPTQHSLTWQVPSTPCAECWLYVVQDNVDTDYTGLVPVSIIAEGSTPPGDGGTQIPPSASEGGGCAVAPVGSSPGAASLGGLMLGIALLLGRGMRYRRTGARFRATRAGCRRARARAAARRL